VLTECTVTGSLVLSGGAFLALSQAVQELALANALARTVGVESGQVTVLRLEEGKDWGGNDEDKDGEWVEEADGEWKEEGTSSDDASSGSAEGINAPPMSSMQFHRRRLRSSSSRHRRSRGSTNSMDWRQQQRREEWREQRREQRRDQWRKRRLSDESYGLPSPSWSSSRLSAASSRPSSSSSEAAIEAPLSVAADFTKVQLSHSFRPQFILTPHVFSFSLPPSVTRHVDCARNVHHFKRHITSSVACMVWDQTNSSSGTKQRWRGRMGHKHGPTEAYMSTICRRTP
jgi:hypothetical protein